MKYVLSILLLLAPVSGFAADTTQPVKAIMDLAKKTWVPGANSDENYFDVAHLKYFSSEFTKTFHEAEKHPAYDTDTGVGYPFEYEEAVDGNTPVEVTFNGKSCMEGEEAKDLTHLTFVVTEEGGKQVIDDIIREGDDSQETTNSLRDEMDKIIEGQ